jgi:hypothetical protein
MHDETARLPVVMTWWEPGGGVVPCRVTSSTPHERGFQPSAYAVEKRSRTGAEGG